MTSALTTVRYDRQNRIMPKPDTASPDYSNVLSIRGLVEGDGVDADLETTLFPDRDHLT